MIMQYLIFNEDGEVTMEDDVNEDDYSMLSWPKIVRLTEIGCGLIKAEELDLDHNWRDV